uniref:N-acetyltransferase domain-containing protein n=1 Tax=Pseudo-nitzschia australis TaxID=44445 RepID=A0A7S4AXY7_9STRA|mmetsp:Transcript_19933/g.43337  ORF Transcript_19933/g.43337 Transcript_19933/m.43337 type:complete len:369 (-) Transcript_19933:57-1163(-)
MIKNAISPLTFNIHSKFFEMSYTTMINRTSLLFLIPCAFAFVEQWHLQQNGRTTSQSNRSISSSSRRHLIPLAKFDESVSFLSESENYRCCIDDRGYFSKKSGSGDDFDRYELGLVEEEELPDLCKFVVTAFGAEAIQLSSDINSFERMLLNPAAEFLNGYSGLVAFAEVFSGTKQRLADRFREHPSLVDISAPALKGLSREERIRKVERESLVLVLARATNDTGDKNSKSIEVIASIELRLQPCDAKIPFSIPWLDRVERRIGSLVGLGNIDDVAGSNDLQPYLSNLCVDEKFRGQKIGRGLVRCIENVAKNSWGYNRIYLHVDEDNIAALNLYKSEGYRDVGHRWNPFWSGGASEIGYYVKSLSSK